MIKNLELDIRFLLFKALCKHRGIFKKCEGGISLGYSRYYNAFESALLKKGSLPAEFVVYYQDERPAPV